MALYLIEFKRPKVVFGSSFLSNPLFLEKERRKGGEEARAWEISSSRWDFFPLLAPL